MDSNLGKMGTRKKAFRKLGGGFDLSDLDLTYAWTMFKSNIHTIDYHCTIIVASVTYYVFYDPTTGFVTANSKVSTTTTPTATTLQDLINANPSVDFNIESYYNEDGSKNLARTNSTGTDSNARIVNGSTGLVEQFNGTTCINWTSLYSSRLVTPDTILNSGNDFTITIVGTAGAGRIFCSQSTADQDNLQMYVANTDIGTIRNNESSTSYNVTYISSQAANTGQRVLTLVVDGTAKTMTAYLDGVFQDTETWVGTYAGNNIVLGSWVNAAQRFTGTSQFLGISTQKYDATKVTLMYSKLQTILGL